jgi:signal peptidase II
MSPSRKSILIILLILVLDQLLKIWVKTNMFLYQDIHVFGNWFIIKFIENNGMAFGFNLPGDYGKMILSIFRIIAVIAIIFYMRHLIREKISNGLLISLSFILAGAIGNIIDSAFYGLIFNESSPYSKAVIFPESGGYSSFLHGKVVDMLYFPVLQGTWPEWIPLKGGQDFEFFRPVFNLSDTAITVGVVTILLFQKKFFSRPVPLENEPIQPENNGSDSSVTRD